jgi:hypothetical protein
MESRPRSKLTYANVMSTIAVFLALGGAAVAGTDALTGKITKAKIKKIAAKEIAKAAPALSVAHATTADTAANAGNATNADHAAAADSATNAAHAASADTAVSADTAGLLDGFDANALIRTAGASTANAADTNGTAMTTTIQAPGPGFLTIFATADLIYGVSDDQVECALQIDEATVPGTLRGNNISGTAGVDADCATNVTRSVAVGSHKVDLEITQLGGASLGAAALSVIFTPFNSTGGVG